MSDHQIFISYSRKDKKKVYSIYKKIEKQFGSGSCWIDLKGIECDDEFVDVIINAIEKAKILLFFYSSNSADSKWTKKEVEYAASLNKRLIIIKIDSYPLRGYFQFQYLNHNIIDYSDREQRDKLFVNIGQWLQIETSPPENHFRKHLVCALSAFTIIAGCVAYTYCLHRKREGAKIEQISDSTTILKADSSQLIPIGKKSIPAIVPTASSESPKPSSAPSSPSKTPEIPSVFKGYSNSAKISCEHYFIPTSNKILGKRIALVIGNSSYQSESPLKNVGHDIDILSTRLNELGFDVLKYKNCSNEEMKAALDEFRQRAGGYDVDLIYYSGHGKSEQNSGHNEYLLGIDYVDGNVSATSSLSDLCSNIDCTKSHIVIIDACRTNSRITESSPALTIEVPSGICLLFSTRSGETALDSGNGESSYFANEFIRHIGSGKTISEEFDQIRLGVKRISGQEPMFQNALSAPFYFMPPNANKKSDVAKEPVQQHQTAVYSYSKEEVKKAKSDARTIWRSLKKQGFEMLEMANPEERMSEYILASMHCRSIIGTAEACISSNMGKSVARNNAINEYSSLAGNTVKGEIQSELAKNGNFQSEKYIAIYKSNFSKVIQNEMKLSMTLIRNNKGKFDVREYYLVENGKFDVAVDSIKKQLLISIEHSNEK